jgi:hypothetical protein
MTIILTFGISSDSEINLFVLFSPSCMLKNLVKMQRSPREWEIPVLCLDGIEIGIECGCRTAIG